jgi:hypothetical protein
MPLIPDGHRDLLDQPIVTLATIGPDGPPRLGGDEAMRDVVRVQDLRFAAVEGGRPPQFAVASASADWG